MVKYKMIFLNQPSFIVERYGTFFSFSDIHVANTTIKRTFGFNV